MDAVSTPWRCTRRRYREICEVLGYFMYGPDNAAVLTSALDESPLRGQKEVSCQVTCTRIRPRTTWNSSCCCASLACSGSSNVWSQSASVRHRAATCSCQLTRTRIRPPITWNSSGCCASLAHLMPSDIGGQPASVRYTELRDLGALRAESSLRENPR